MEAKESTILVVDSQSADFISFLKIPEFQTTGNRQ